MTWKICACNDAAELWLGDAVGVGLDASGLRALVQGMTRACNDQAHAAQTLFQHVAQLPFSVSDLEQRCNPRLLALNHEGDAYFKATLLLHLLRLEGIPARLRWVQLQSELLTRGLWDFVRHTGQAFVYPLTEAFLAGRWLCTDAYILDAPLLLAVHRQLDSREWLSGFLAHRSGVAQWDAQGDAHQRFVADDPSGMGVQDLGCSHSHADFVRMAPQHFKETRVFQLAYASQAVLMTQELNRMRLNG